MWLWHRRLIAYCLLGIAVAAVLPTACARLGDSVSTETPAATKWPIADGTLSAVFRVEVYTATLMLPDGTVTLPKVCSQASADIRHCYLEFPNGNQFETTGGVFWAADHRFAIECNAIFHDSPGCGHFRIWNMDDGTFLDTRLPGGGVYAWFRWAPEGHTLAYYVDNYPLYPQRLVLLDAATGRETYPTECPSWVKEADTLRVPGRARQDELLEWCSQQE